MGELSLLFLFLVVSHTYILLVNLPGLYFSVVIVILTEQQRNEVKIRMKDAIVGSHQNLNSSLLVLSLQNTHLTK